MQISLRLRRTNDYNSSTDALKVRVLASLAAPRSFRSRALGSFSARRTTAKRAYRELHFGEGATMGKALLKALECTDIEKAISKSKARLVVKNNRCALVSERAFVKGA